jgi:hypothetical protein
MTRMTRFLVTCTMAIASFAPEVAAQPAPTAVVAIVGGTILDLSASGTEGRDQADMIVLIADGRILAAGRRGEVSVPPQAKVVDATGKFLAPGLIDGFAGMNGPGQAAAYLYSGVTSIVGVQDPRRGALDLKARPAPRVFPLEAIGYGAEENTYVRSAADARKQVDETVASGAKVLLLMYPLELDGLVAAAARAHELGIPTIGELGRTPYASALAAGVDAVVHTSRYSLPLAPAELRARVADEPFGPPKLEYYQGLVKTFAKDTAAVEAWAGRLGASRTALIPTLAMEYLDLPGHKNPWDFDAARFLDPQGIHQPADRKTGERSERAEAGADAFPADLAATLVALEERYSRAGANYLAGSGTSAFGTMPGISLHHELELLTRIGLSAREALAAATDNYRQAFGWRDLGCLEPGCHADVLVLAKDPTRDLSALWDIDVLVVAGEVVDRARLLADRKID